MTMKAIQYLSYGDYAQNRLVDLPRPELRDGEVLVEMRTVGVNPLDNTFRSGHIYLATPENLPRVGGQTGAGVVLESRSETFKPGQSVLAPAIGGAVGMETVQVARHLGASLAISTASTTEKAERAQAAGYEHVILPRESLKNGVFTGGKGVDVVVDGVSGQLTGQALASLAQGGTLVIAGL